MKDERRVSLDELRNAAAMIEREYEKTVDPVMIPPLDTWLAKEKVSVDIDNVPVFMLAEHTFRPRGYKVNYDLLDDKEKYDPETDKEKAQEYFLQVYNNRVFLEGQILVSHNTLLHVRSDIFIDEAIALRVAAQMQKKGFNVQYDEETNWLRCHDRHFTLEQGLGPANETQYASHKSLTGALKTLVCQAYLGATAMIDSGVPDQGYKTDSAGQNIKRSGKRNSRLYYFSEMSTEEFASLHDFIQRFNLELVCAMNQELLGKQVQPVFHKKVITEADLASGFLEDSKFYRLVFPDLVKFIDDASQTIRSQNYDGINELMEKGKRIRSGVEEYAGSPLYDRFAFTYGYLIGMAVRDGVEDFQINKVLSNMDSQQRISDVRGTSLANIIVSVSKRQDTDELRTRDPAAGKWFFGGILLALDDIVPASVLDYALDTNPIHIRSRNMGKDLKEAMAEVFKRRIKI
jgi:hypothetical protein